jgi:hypothetical protein
VLIQGEIQVGQLRMLSLADGEGFFHSFLGSLALCAGRWLAEALR